MPLRNDIGRSTDSRYLVDDIRVPEAPPKIQPYVPDVSTGIESAYSERDTYIRVTTYNAGIAVSPNLTFRLIRKNGNIVWYAATFSIATGMQTSYIPATDAMLVSLAFSGLGITINRGELYVTVDLVKGNQANAVLLQTLCGDYLTAQGISYPKTGIVQPTSGIGVLTENTLPPVGVPPYILHTTPANRLEKLLSFSFTYTASAVAGDRKVFASVRTVGATVVQLFPASIVQPPSTSMEYRFACTPSTGVITLLSDFCFVEIPYNVLMQTNFEIFVNALNADPVGDSVIPLSVFTESLIAVS